MGNSCERRKGDAKERYNKNENEGCVYHRLRRDNCEKGIEWNEESYIQRAHIRGKREVEV